MKTKTIRQTVKFNDSPEDVYDTLMDSKKHANFTQSPAKISTKEGGKISAYDGYIQGKNVRLIPNKKIVQDWRSMEWPHGHFSQVTFEIKSQGKGSLLKFTQTGVPQEHHAAISKGWKEHYWTKMKKFLEQQTTDKHYIFYQFLL